MSDEKGTRYFVSSGKFRSGPHGSVSRRSLDHRTGHGNGCDISEHTGVSLSLSGASVYAPMDHRKGRLKAIRIAAAENRNILRWKTDVHFTPRMPIITSRAAVSRFCSMPWREEMCRYCRRKQIRRGREGGGGGGGGMQCWRHEYHSRHCRERQNLAVSHKPGFMTKKIDEDTDIVLRLHQR
jgi:hypothetical protein